jgi:phosphopantetheinyl transferase (holo-ACP synthase)
VPFTALMEMMAEAALTLAPGRILVGMSDVRVSRWAAVDEAPLVFELHADRIDASSTRVRIIDTAAPALGPLAEGVMRLGDRHPAAPYAQPLTLADAAPSAVPPGELYDTAMFHGPAFQGVASIDAVGAAGARASLEVLDPARSAPHRGPFVTDFVLLDQPGQVVGFWAAQRLDRGFFVLPLRLRSLDLFAPPPPAGERLTCLAHVTITSDQELSSTLDVVRSDGRLWARFEGWDDRRFDLPAAAHQLLMRPRTARLSRPCAWPAGANGDAFRVGLETFPPGWLNAHGGLWRRVIAALVLGRREREIWRVARMPEPRRLEWLLGRIAAKDAVREQVRRRHGVDLRPADIEILPDSNGRPLVCGLPGSVRPPVVSISHVDGAAIAIAGDAETLTGIGIDLEKRGRMTGEMEQVAFSVAEREALDLFLGDERSGWAIRLWCAKEAFAKSTGCATPPMSRALAIERVDVNDGTVVLTYAPPDGHRISVPVATMVDGDWVVAACVAVAEMAATEGVR